MRIYLPATMSALAPAAGLTARNAHVVTPALRQQMGEEEDAEHAALLLAAQDSLDLLAGAPAPPLRVVVAAEIDPLPVPSGEHAQIPAPDVPWARVVSFHVDDGDDPGTRRTIAAALGGSPDARAAAAELDLLWYDATERETLIAQWA